MKKAFPGALETAPRTPRRPRGWKKSEKIEIQYQIYHVNIFLTFRFHDIYRYEIFFSFEISMPSFHIDTRQTLLAWLFGRAGAVCAAALLPGRLSFGVRHARGCACRAAAAAGAAPGGLSWPLGVAWGRGRGLLGVLAAPVLSTLPL